jgi:hypothetical protein
MLNFLVRPRLSFVELIAFGVFVVYTDNQSIVQIVLAMAAYSAIVLVNSAILKSKYGQKVDDND